MRGKVEMKKNEKRVSIICIMILLVTFLTIILYPNKTQAYTASELKTKLEEVHWSSDIIDRSGETWTFRENSSKYGGGTCWGFANAVGLYLFNCHQNSNFNDWLITRNVDELCVGDTIRYKERYTNHSLVVINVTGDTIHVADANYDNHNGIRWDVKLSKSEVNSMISQRLWYSELSGSQEYRIF